eukprot:COSAG02_NODE_72411_length_185_cov_118.209302_1_plen_33_part_01
MNPKSRIRSRVDTRGVVRTWTARALIHINLAVP